MSLDSVDGTARSRAASMDSVDGTAGAHADESVDGTATSGDCAGGATEGCEEGTLIEVPASSDSDSEPAGD